MTTKTSLSWTTGLELEFIKDIGKHSECCKGRIARVDLLRGYLEHQAKNRTEWNNIDKGEVMAFALTEMVREELNDKQI